MIEAYNVTWDKFNSLMKKGFDSDTVYDDKYVNTKVKPFGDKIKTNFHDSDAPNERAHCLLYG